MKHERVRVDADGDVSSIDEVPTHRFVGRIIKVSPIFDYAFIDIGTVRREDGGEELGIPDSKDLMLHVKENRAIEWQLHVGVTINFRVALSNHPHRRNRLSVFDAQRVRNPT